MSKVIYLGHYSRVEDARSVSPAGATMMEYVAQSINDAGYDLTMISLSQAKDKSSKPIKIKKINEKTDIVYLSSLKQYRKRNYIMRFLQKMRRERKHYKELSSLIKEGDIVVAYHSLALIKNLKKLRKKIKFKLILQVCEIYADVLENKKIRKKEVDFISNADSYIFSSCLLEKEFNKQNKVFAICLGKYSVEPSRNVKFDDDKIHVVYAGTLDPRKGGGMAAVEATTHLDEKYRVHILGFGSEQEIADIETKIEETNAKGKCVVSYDGCLSGEEYIQFLQKCQIGLSTQNPNATFNATSFPSKILVYLANGLQAVSIKIPAIETSSVAGAISFYDVQTPEEIANAIKNIDYTKKVDSKNILCRLDSDFVSKIQMLLE